MQKNNQNLPMLTTSECCLAWKADIYTAQYTRVVSVDTSHEELYEDYMCRSLLYIMHEWNFDSRIELCVAGEENLKASGIVRF